MLRGRKSPSRSLAVLFPLCSVSKQVPSHFTQFQVLTPLFAFRVSLNYSSGRRSELPAYLPPGTTALPAICPLLLQTHRCARHPSPLQLRSPLVPEIPRLRLGSSFLLGLPPRRCPLQAISPGNRRSTPSSNAVPLVSPIPTPT